MLKNKLIPSKKSLYKIFRKKGSKVLILSKSAFSQNIFEDIASTVESDLHSSNFNYKGGTVLQIQLLANLYNEERITLIKIKNFAIVVIQ